MTVHPENVSSPRGVLHLKVSMLSGRQTRGAPRHRRLIVLPQETHETPVRTVDLEVERSSSFSLGVVLALVSSGSPVGTWSDVIMDQVGNECQCAKPLMRRGRTGTHGQRRYLISRRSSWHKLPSPSGAEKYSERALPEAFAVDSEVPNSPSLRHRRHKISPAYADPRF